MQQGSQFETGKKYFVPVDFEKSKIFCANGSRVKVLSQLTHKRNISCTKDSLKKKFSHESTADKSAGEKYFVAVVQERKSMYDHTVVPAIKKNTAKNNYCGRTVVFSSRSVHTWKSGRKLKKPPPVTDVIKLLTETAEAKTGVENRNGRNQSLFTVYLVA